MKALFDLIKEKKVQLTICVVLGAVSSLLLIVPFALIYKIVAYYLQEGWGASPEPVIVWLGIASIALILRYALTVSSLRIQPYRGLRPSLPDTYQNNKAYRQTPDGLLGKAQLRRDFENRTGGR